MLSPRLSFGFGSILCWCGKLRSLYTEYGSYQAIVPTYSSDPASEKSPTHSATESSFASCSPEWYKSLGAMVPRSCGEHCVVPEYWNAIGELSFTVIVGQGAECWKGDH